MFRTVPYGKTGNGEGMATDCSGVVREQSEHARTCRGTALAYMR